MDLEVGRAGACLAPSQRLFLGSLPPAISLRSGCPVVLPRGEVAEWLPDTPLSESCRIECAETLHNPGAAGEVCEKSVLPPSAGDCCA